MLWNQLIRILARAVYFRHGAFKAFQLPRRETHRRLFGKDRFQMDLSYGMLQKTLFLKPDTYEPETQQALRKLIRPGMTVFDVGANSGYFTLLMADRVGPAGRVYSFEPHPANFELLLSNIQANSLAHVHAFKLALSDRRGEAVLSLNP